MPPSPTHVSWGAIVAGFGPIAVVLVACGLVLGTGPVLIVLGVSALSAGIRSVLPRIGRPAAVATAVLAEAMLLLGASAATAVIHPGEHAWPVDIAILALPLVGAGLLLVVGRRSWRQWGGSPIGNASLVVMLVMLLTQAMVTARGTNFGVAWALSGDARNHLLFVRRLITNGGITVDQVASYPVGINTISAIISGSSPRAGLDVGQLMLHDAEALSATYLLVMMGITALLTATLCQFLPRRSQRLGRAPVGVFIVLIAAGLTSVSPFLLGTALTDGFFSAYGALTFALAGSVVAVRSIARRRPEPWMFVSLAVSIVLTFVSWTLLALVPIAATLAVSLMVVVRDARGGTLAPTRQRVLGYAALGLPAVTTVGLMIVIAVHLDRLVATFALSGAIVPPSPWLFVLIVLLIVAAWVVMRRHRAALALAASVALLGLMVILWLGAIPSTGLSWSYYAAKTLWLVCGTLLWVLFLPALAVATTKRATAPMAVAGASLSAAVFAILALASNAGDPIPKAMTGWAQPSATSLTKVAEVASESRSFVFWDWNDFGEDRLANFWSAFNWESSREGEWRNDAKFAVWAYLYTGDMNDLCEVTAENPGIDIITSSSTLAAEFTASCGETHGANIIETTRP